MTGFRRQLVFVALLLVPVSVSVVGLTAQAIKNEAARRLESVEGVDSFKEYCAVCHGANAKGDGPAAKSLKTPPPDLTTIAKRKGRFSAADVETRIAGKSLSGAHGSGEMPIWGHVFESIAPDSSVARLRVNNLVNYIRSIQIQ
jgi:mono/diheme cytochrome c family protein